MIHSKSKLFFGLAILLSCLRPSIADGSISLFSTTAARPTYTVSSVTAIRGGAAAIPAPKGKRVLTKKHVATSVGHDDELMSSPTAVANVLADLCPHGMLPIAYGMAAAGGTGPVLATAVLVVFGALSWYSLVSFARAADVVLVQSKEEHAAGESLSAVWERTVPNGKLTTYIPDVGCVFLTVGCLLFYSAFIGDIFGSLVSGVKGLPSVLQKRWPVLLLLHAVPILPLCLKKDLSALKYSSMTGLLGIFYTVFFVGKRLVDGSYAEGGKYFDLMATKFQPAPLANFPHTQSGVLGYLADIPSMYAGKGLFTLMNMCCVAYACHYNAVKYYMELKDRTVPTLKGVMAAGIGGTGLVFWCMMMLGFATFGKHSQALLLNNYHSSVDLMATAARLFTGIAIISGYALMFAGLKAALFSLLKLDQPNTTNRDLKQNTISFGILSAIAVAACFVTEHELATVIGIVGSVFGSIVIYIFPAIVNISLLAKRDKKGNRIAALFFPGEVLFNKLMILFGAMFAVLGTWISLASDDH
jgi:amino acid permease